MNISEVARKSGVPAKTIRYYESIGLISAPPRSEGGYRVYGTRDMETLRFIQRARSLGFAVKDVADLLALWHDRTRASAEVKSVAARHVAEIERKIAELESMRATLAALVERCHGDDRPDCPILEGLAGEGACCGS
ncbi:Cu(I)-responsive transcriptional regulator [Novispirillum sp. DQ9]|uniref:Cu(I)-responsive transcriptional regulator n=1 Tax=Novispirillum sp. DQ9 TaxID=3398612 RepID=UPI003C7EB248